MSIIILGIEVIVLFCVVAISIIWTIIQERFHNLCTPLSFSNAWDNYSNRIYRWI